MAPMTISKLLMATAVLAAVVFTSVADATPPDHIVQLSGEDLLVNLDLETEEAANLEHEIGEADQWGFFKKKKKAPPAKQCYLKKTNGKDSGDTGKMKQRLDERRKGCVGYFTSAKSKRGCNIFGVVDGGFLGGNFGVTKKRCYKYCKSENPAKGAETAADDDVENELQSGLERKRRRRWVAAGAADENACKDGCNYMRCNDNLQKGRGCEYSNPRWTKTRALDRPTECKGSFWGEEEVDQARGRRSRRGEEEVDLEDDEAYGGGATSSVLRTSPPVEVSRRLIRRPEGKEEVDLEDDEAYSGGTVANTPASTKNRKKVDQQVDQDDLENDLEDDEETSWGRLHKIIRGNRHGDLESNLADDGESSWSKKKPAGKCVKVCYKDGCKGTWSNPISKGQQWKRKGGYVGSGCCSWGAGRCDNCCPP